MATVTVPVNITPEAAERIAERGLKEPLDQMIEQAVKLVPGIRSIEIHLDGPYETHDEPYLAAFVYRDGGLRVGSTPEEDRYSHWTIESFSPDVWSQISLFFRSDAPDAG